MALSTGGIWCDKSGLLGAHMTINQACVWLYVTVGIGDRYEYIRVLPALEAKLHETASKGQQRSWKGSR